MSDKRIRNPLEGGDPGSRGVAALDAAVLEDGLDARGAADVAVDALHVAGKTSETDAVVPFVDQRCKLRVGAARHHVVKQRCNPRVGAARRHLLGGEGPGGRASPHGLLSGLGLLLAQAIIGVARV